MKTERLTHEQTERVAALLKMSACVAFPTDTVYGLGALFADEKGRDALYEAKNRPQEKPLPVMCSDVAMVRRVATVDQRAAFLLDRWMPGAVTFVLNHLPQLDDDLFGGKRTVAIRIPDDPWILGLIRMLDQPLYVTSANISGELAATDGDQAYAQLNGRIAAVVAGHSRQQRASAIFDLSATEIFTLRQGEVTQEDILRSLTENTEGR